MDHFDEVKKKFKAAVQSILTDNSSLEIDEAALPAYAHKNPVVDYIFWQRVKVALNFAIKKNAQNILDFGCGSGILSYSLATMGKNVTAVDIHFGPLNLIKQKINFPTNINFIEADLLKYEMKEKQFDLIIALDVLEHIEDLKTYISEFRKILKPGGMILVSGPTENFLYKIGRRLAGEKFTGDYHVSNIHKIKRTFSEQMETETISKLVWPLTLFEVFIAHNR